MPPQDPYRDDRLTLLAENERLRGILRAVRSRRRRVFVLASAVLGLGVADALMFGVVRSLINAQNDLRAMGGFALAVLLVVAHPVVAIRVASRGE